MTARVETLADCEANATNAAAIDGVHPVVVIESDAP
jgi:hypothetical protein